MADHSYYYGWPDTVTVRSTGLGTNLCAIRCDNMFSICITPEVAAKLCFDLLNVIPASVVAEHLIKGGRDALDKTEWNMPWPADAVLCGEPVSTGGLCRLPKNHKGFCSPTLERKP